VAGDVADGEAAIAPIRALGAGADFFGPTPYADFQCSVDDPPGYRNYWTAENVADLPDEAIDVLVVALRNCRPDRRSSSSSPGAAQSGASAAATHRWAAVTRASSSTRCCSGTTQRTTPATSISAARSAATWAVGDGASYPNFLGDESAARIAAAYGASAGRVAALKAEWDPHNVFRTHQSIPTTTNKEGL
jgi:FAD/FMN-containing dehydrogenase